MKVHEYTATTITTNSSAAAAAVGYCIYIRL